MPELPEVEAVARSLRPIVRGQKIRCVHVLHPVVLGGRRVADLSRLVEGRMRGVVACEDRSAARGEFIEARRGGATA